MLFRIAYPLIPSEYCPKFSNTDCNNCLTNTILNKEVNISCGYCISTKECVPGDSLGPFIGSCVDWIVDIKNETCIKDSSLALPKGMRIGIGVLVAFTCITTPVYWIYIFPKKNMREFY